MIAPGTSAGTATAQFPPPSSPAAASWNHAPGGGRSGPCSIPSGSPIGNALAGLDLVLLDALADLEVCIRQPAMPPDLPTIRLHCGSALNRRSTLVLTQVIPVLNEDRCKDCRALALRLRRDMIELYAFHAEHITSWTLSAIQTDWTRYRADAAVKLAKVTEHLQSYGSSVPASTAVPRMGARTDRR